MKKDELLSQLKQLVSFETLSGNFEQNEQALDYVCSLLNKKAKITRLKNKDTEILIVGNTDSKSPDIGYLVHMDIVAAKKNQFKVKVKGDKAFGRGVSDMKYSIPLGIQLLNQLIERESNLTFSLVITTDEETGGFAGGYFLANEYNLRPKLLIVPDGGDNYIFVDKAKGVCQLIIESSGAPAHASRPWMGRNALTPVVKLASELERIYGKNSLEENWNTTMNIGQIHGGISTNQVCPEATMKLDFRYPETDSIEKITTQVKTLAEKIDSRLQVTQASTGLPTFTDTNLPEVKLFIESMNKEVGKPLKIKPTYGASDARHFAAFNIPVLMTKPMGGEIHSDNEWISISSCLKYFDGLERFCFELEGQIYG